MATTNFDQWNPGAVNQENDAAYAADPQRSGGAVGGVYPAATHNKLSYQVSIMVAALAAMLVDKGYSPNDGSATPGTALNDLKGVLANLITQIDLTAFQAALLAGFATDFVGTDGYIKLPDVLGGFIIQWAQGPTDAATELATSVTFPIAFPTACLMVQVSLDTLGFSGNANDCWYQVRSFTSTAVALYKQGSGGTLQTSKALILAVGH